MGGKEEEGDGKAAPPAAAGRNPRRGARGSHERACSRVFSTCGLSGRSRIFVTRAVTYKFSVLILCHAWMNVSVHWLA